MELSGADNCFESRLLRVEKTESSATVKYAVSFVVMQDNVAYIRSARVVE